MAARHAPLMPPDDAPAKPAAGPRGPLLVAVVVFLLALGSFSRSLGFSWHFHADEGSKILQIQNDTRNFNHPLLLLHSVEAAAWLTGASTPHEIVLCGRRVSLVAMAATCALLAAAVALRAGTSWGALAGALLLVHPASFTYAHFFKEDPLLVLGLAVAVLGLAHTRRNHCRAAAILVGVGLGLALGAKYIGLVWWPFLLAALANAPQPHARRLWLQALALALGIFGLLQLPALFHLDELRHALQSELSKAAHVPGSNAKEASAAAIYLSDISPLHIAIPAVFSLAGLVLAARRGDWSDFWLGLAPWCYLAILCTASKEADRYLLPWHLMVITASVVAAASIIASLPTHIRARLHRHVIPALVLLVFAVPLHGLWKSQRAALRRLENESHRIATIDHIRNTLPAEAVVFYGARVGLVDPTYPEQYPAAITPLPQLVRYVPDPWSYRDVAGLRAAGATHYLASQQLDREERVARGNNKREFFRDFRARTRIVFRSDRGSDSYFPMQLVLYELLADAQPP